MLHIQSPKYRSPSRPPIGELFPANVKELASSIAAMFNWSMAFIVTLLYLPLQVRRSQGFLGRESFGVLPLQVRRS